MARLADPALADRRRRQIMDAALSCFRRRGFHQATMQEICAEANISAGALYRYFSSKAEIIGAIAEDHRGEDDSAFVHAAETLGLIEAVAQAGERFFQKFAQGDGALIADICAEAIRDEAIAATLRAIDVKSVEMFIHAIRSAQERGEVDRSLDAKLAAETLFAAIEGIGLRRAFQRNTDPAQAAAQFRSLAQRFLRPSYE
ncbi:MAG: TetR/AcrR family transcriptional regulator [Hyphomonadaceae bacterium]|nr:TetR/AcrR family transcriptional regulator [Hyphomonadaceae bacterium]